MYKTGVSEADYLLRSGVFMTVAEASKKMGCSDRRVRTLLAQNRLLGQFNEAKRCWLVNNPLRVTYGQRGPKLGQKPERNTNDSDERG